MKDSKGRSEYKMKRNSPEWKIEMGKTGEDRRHIKGGEKNVTWKEIEETLEKHM
jgi:hypothetical protein